jgi:hypothetical protein
MFLSRSYRLVSFISLQRSGIELIAPILHTRQRTLHCLYQFISQSSPVQTSRITALYPLPTRQCGKDLDLTLFEISKT